MDLLYIDTKNYDMAGVDARLHAGVCQRCQIDNKHFQNPNPVIRYD